MTDSNTNVSATATTASTKSKAKSQWNIKGLVIIHLLVLIALISWLWEPTRGIWDKADNQLFNVLNHTVQKDDIWSRVCAIANLRVSDLLVALVMGGLVVKRNFIFSASQVRAGLFTVLSLLILMAGFSLGTEALLKKLDYKRESPSMVLENAHRLSELFPDWDVKDSSSKSFPGDHATVILVWALFLTLFAKGRRLALVWTVAIIAMMPRLIAGAHWGSDDFVGGLVIAMLTIGWGYCTPYATWMIGAIDYLTQPTFRLLRQIPLLNKMAILQDRGPLEGIL